MSGLQCLFWACIQLNFNLSLTISEPFWFRTFCAAHAHFCLLPGPQWVWPSAVSQFSILMNHTSYLIYFLWRLMRTLVSAIYMACSEPGQASGLQWVFEEATLATPARLLLPNLRCWCTFCNQPLSAHQLLLKIYDLSHVHILCASYALSYKFSTFATNMNGNLEIEAKQFQLSLYKTSTCVWWIVIFVFLKFRS